MRFLVFVLSLSACGFGDNGRSELIGGPDAGSDPPVDAPEDPPADGEVPPPPDGTPAACSIIPQGGCPAGDACDLDFSDGSHECRDVTANGTADSICTSDTACAAGFACLGSDGVFWCHRFCELDSQCGGGSRCLLELADDNDNVLPERVCTNACNPLAQTGCPADTACHIYDDGGQDFTDCDPFGTTADGGACTDNSDCRAGSICVGGATDRCAEICDLDAAVNTCGAGKTCRAFGVSVFIGGIDYGFCE